MCIYGQLVKPSDFRQPNVETLVQVIKAERGDSELSCVIDKDQRGCLQAIRMGQTAETHQTTYTVAHMAVQTSDALLVTSHSSDQVPEGLRKTIGSHIWLANLASSSDGMALKPPFQSPPNPVGLTARRHSSWTRTHN